MTADQGFCYSNGLLANGPLRASSGYAPIGKAAISSSESEKQYLAVWSGKWFDDPGDPYRIYSSVLVQTAALQTTTIAYQYDPLNRLTEAAYSGLFNGGYEYVYDAVGNRVFHSANITTSKSITYAYDIANRLQQSVDQDGLITTYAWDAMSRLITTTVDSQVSRVYQYSQDGKLLSADVDGLLTTFAYDGQGNRLLMSVAGEVTTYTLDTANKGQILLEQGGVFAQTKHYLYGLECIGELVDAGEPETEEWRYYHRDGANLVRQTTNSQAEITLAWAYSPDGAVLIGAKGPVTNLGCGDIYDWSTGLVYKGGRYFDPTLGIWLTLAPFVVWQKYKLGKRRGKSKRKRRDRKELFLLFLFLLVVALVLTGCGPNPPDPTQTPLPIPCPTPDSTGTPIPILPPALPPDTPTPWPTDPPPATGTPQPPIPTPHLGLEATIEELIRNWPINQVAYTNHDQLKFDIRLLINESARSGNNMSVDQLAFFLATAYDESKIGRDMVEPEAHVALYGYEGRDGLCNWKDGDGSTFKGRGFTHITGRCLYTYYDQHPQFTGKNILDNPHIIAEDRDLSAAISVHSMVTGAPQSMSVHWSGTPMASPITNIIHNQQGAKLSDFERGNDYEWGGASAIQGQPYGQINVDVAKSFSNILRSRCLTGALPTGISCKQ